MKKIFAIYPVDKSNSTQSLNRVHMYESRNLSVVWHCFKVHCSEFDHEHCLEIARNEDILCVVFMGHGREEYLFGACGKHGNDFTTGEFVGDDFFNHQNFINGENINVFRNKVFVCFSCFSNRKTNKSLSSHAINNGVKTFVGFGDMPTDYFRGCPYTRTELQIYKGLLSRILKRALYLVVDGNGTVVQFVELLTLLTTQEMQAIMFSRYRAKKKSQLLKLLYDFKNEIRIFGDRYSTMI